jgi:putative addiction module CopG family antidote
VLDRDHRQWVRRSLWRPQTCAGWVDWTNLRQRSRSPQRPIHGQCRHMLYWKLLSSRGEPMNLNGLPADLEQFIRQELARGKYPSEADLVAEAVRLLRECERRLEELRKELQPALEALDRGEYTEYDENSLRDMIEDVKARGRTRLAERRPSTL